MAAVKAAVQQLLAGDSAATVMAEMRKTYTTPESMKKHMSLVRSKIMEGGHYSHLFDTSSLQKFAEIPEIGALASDEFCKRSAVSSTSRFALWNSAWRF